MDISDIENEKAIDHLNFICQSQVFIIVRLRDKIKLDTQVLLGKVTKTHWTENQVTYKATPV